MYRCPLDKARLLREGKDITILGFSYGIVESLKAHSVLELGGINAEVIDGVSAAPLDMETIIKSVKKTGRLVVVDTGHKTGSIGGEVVRQVCEQVFRYLRSAPTVVACADYPQPTSHFISHEYYPDVSDVVNACYVACGKKAKMVREVNENHDVQEKYVGPF
jgi:pyruvate dehydrogenase E1 component beta subunit